MIVKGKSFTDVVNELYPDKCVHILSVITELFKYSFKVSKSEHLGCTHLCFDCVPSFFDCLL